MKHNVMTMDGKYDISGNFYPIDGNKINIWCAYHNEKLIQDYDLNEQQKKNHII